MNILSKALSRHGRHRCCPPLAFQRSSSFPFLSFADRDDEQQIIISPNAEHRTISSLTNNNTYHPISSSAYNTYNNSYLRCRKYHTTSKKEILPFIAAGIVVGGVVYTYRTFEQMDRDWETYYDKVEEYKARTGIDPEASSTDSSTTDNTDASNTNNNTDISTFFTGGTMAIDMGTTRLKLSHRPSLSQKINTQHKPPVPVVSVNREGFRSTPSQVWLPPSSEEGKEDALVGRLAESRLYDTRGGRVVHPCDFLLEGGDGNGSADIEAIQQTIRDVASNALDQALGTSSGSSSAKSSSNPLFVLDASMSTSGSYNVRPIFTYPVQSTTTTVDTSKQQYVERYEQVVNGLTSPDGIAKYVPEPVAIVSGAEYYNLLPPKSESSSSVLIVDVGGTKTCVSLVGEDDEVLYSSSLPLGGDTFIDLLVSHLVKDFYGTGSEEATASESTTSLSTKPSLNDPTALQRLYEASTTAIHELSNKTRSEINIPYLTMDLNTRQPKHLEVGMSRNVVYAEVEGWIRNKLVPHLQDENNNSDSSLSQSLPPPTNLATLISSIIMSCLESTSHTPSMLRVLLVGGGGRIPLVKSAVQEGVGYLAGDAYVNGAGGGEAKRLIIPEDGMGEELAVLGAAVWGSSKVD